MRIEGREHAANRALDEILHLGLVDIILLNLRQYLGERSQLFVGFGGVAGSFPPLADQHAGHQGHHNHRAQHPESPPLVLFHHMSSFRLPAPIAWPAIAGDRRVPRLRAIQSIKYFLPSCPYRPFHRSPGPIRPAPPPR